MKYTSALQIRIGGAKGVCMVKPSLLEGVELEKVTELSELEIEFHLRQQKTQIELRPSQIKFPTKNITLDICKCATFTQGFLNRQIIVLLYSLGVSQDYFL